MQKLLLLLFTIISLKVSALNINIIQATSNGNTPAYYRWETIALSMGHNAVIHPKTFLDVMANLTATDILILAIASDASVYTPARIANIVLYLQQGGKVYLQSEYSVTYAGNIAYEAVVNALGSQFAWQTQPLTGFLNSVQIVGSIATDSSMAVPLTQSFWWGDPADCDDGMEHFLEYNGDYLGFIYCVPASQGRIITMSDQDLIQNFFTNAVDSLMRNIITNLSKTSYNCDLTAVQCNPLSAPLVASETDKPFSVYPQPASEFIEIHCQNTLTDIKIYNIIGNIVYASAYHKRIDISNLPSGVYFLKLTGNKNNFEKKIVIAK